MATMLSRDANVLGPQSFYGTEKVQKRSLSPKARDGSSGKCTRAWTDEEEKTLLQSRLDRIPYKHIAAKLGKTDLACRLHYHQMAIARKSPDNRTPKNTPSYFADKIPGIQSISPPSTTSPGCFRGSDQLSNLHRDHQSDTHSISSEPPSTSGHRRSASLPQHGLGLYAEGEPFRGTLPQPVPKHKRGPASVDLSRLHDIYKDHSHDFWSTIAIAYSDSETLSATELERAFFAAHRSHVLPSMNTELSATVNIPPISRFSTPSLTSAASYTDDSISLHSRAHSTSPRALVSEDGASARGKCSLSSLLNHAEG